MIVPSGTIPTLESPTRILYTVYMATTPITYRISPEVDQELKRLAKIHGGMDKALRNLLEWAGHETPKTVKVKPVKKASKEGGA